MVIYSIIGLAFIAAAYSLYGGLSAVAWTDVIQVVFLTLGGMITTVIALNHVTPEGGVLHGLDFIYEHAGEKFHMILKRDNPEFFNLPGIAVLIGGLWVANLYYWGFNQYIIQRALAAKSLKEAQRGLAFAGFLKLLIPIFVVIPGIIAFVLYSHPEGASVIPGIDDVFTKPGGGVAYDKAYPWLISTFIPNGLKGVVVAALVAAIISSLASMLNSTSTIFTMDIYKVYIDRNASDKKTVTVGRLSAFFALLIAVIVAPLLGNIPQMFQYIQQYTGMVSPGILAVFLMGLFWKKATNKAAIVGILVSFFIAFALKTPAIDMPWMDQMLYTLLLTMVVIAGVSLTSSNDVDDPKGIPLTAKTFKTGKTFNISAYVIMIILVVLYAVFW
jgi:SSS family solute:Na+ symporter